jgi:CheY-like chemotaxis protein
MSKAIHKPLILGIVADLVMISLIEPIVQESRCIARWIDRIDDLIDERNSNDYQSTGRMSSRQKEALVDNISSLLPITIIIDMNLPGSSWQLYLPILKTDPATRRIPIIAYGNHIQVEELFRARKFGADIVLTRSIFLNQFSRIINRIASKSEKNVLFDPCHARLSAAAIAGIEHFNKENYFQAHEYFEQSWLEDDSPGRDLYRALVQVAVVCFQIGQGNYTGARKMFFRLRQWLTPLPDRCRGIDVAFLREEIHRIELIFLALGSRRLKKFDPEVFPKISYTQ